ncbi:MAG: uroporphyrinogen-III synthase [Gammaproteobacteria bacterium]|nr:uroporphyrinogen-III synthase [Gammaproteobacteria bacterium]
MPLIEIAPVQLARDEGAVGDRYDVVIFLSSHAVVHGFERILERDGSFPARAVCIAVGSRTRAELHSRGVAAISPADERSEGILAMPELAHEASRRVLLVGGVGGRRLLDEALAARGAEVSRIEVYRRGSGAPAGAIDLADFAYVVVSSVAGGEALMQRATSRADGGPAVIVPSARVGEFFRGAGLGRIVVSDGAGSAAVLKAIERCEDRDERDARADPSRKDS